VFDFSGTNSAVSKDHQPINATLVVNFQVEPKQVIQLYKTVGPSWKIVLLDGRIPQDFTRSHPRRVNDGEARPPRRYSGSARRGVRVV
jgi:hypothetical protein